MARLRHRIRAGDVHRRRSGRKAGPEPRATRGARWILRRAARGGAQVARLKLRVLAAKARSAQLTVFAAPAVVAGECGRVAVMRVLALEAQSHTGDRVSARLRDLRTAVGAVREAGALRQAALRPADSVLDGRIDLFLHRAVAGPTGSHVRFSYCAVSPPSATSACSTINDESSLARNSTARAISAGSAIRPSGVPAMAARSTSGCLNHYLSIGVSVPPGQIALMRTPSLM